MQADSYMTLANIRANGMTSSTPHTRNLIAMLALVLTAAALAGCGASARTWAAADCWKSTERDYAKMNVDKRGDIVTKCIDDKMKATR
jgi:hypothetical protein